MAVFWLRVAGLADSTRFNETLVPIVGHQTKARPDRTTVYGDGATFSPRRG
jgi:hypothetical protein